MRELAVFYCPDCGHYAYYQTSRHPVCPKCGDGGKVMCMLKMYYTEFMKMTCEERDNFLAMEMLKRNPSIMARITAPHKRFNSRETIAELCNVIMDLDAENKVLSDTVSWMHDTIWDMLKAQKGLDQESGALAEQVMAQKTADRTRLSRDPDHTESEADPESTAAAEAAVSQTPDLPHK